MQELELGGKTFTLKPWTLDQIEQLEDLFGYAMLDIKGTVGEVRKSFLVTVRGQHGVLTMEDTKAFVTMANISSIEAALNELLTQAIRDRYGAQAAASAEPEGKP